MWDSKSRYSRTCHKQIVITFQQHENTKKLQTFLKLGLIDRKIPIECDTFNGICIALEISYKIITTLFGQ
jgi:hypothetical protein